jgi:hypothetical protein
MPRTGSKHPYKPRREYTYTVKDIAELAGMTRNALGIAKVHGKIDPGDFRSVVSFLIRRTIDRRLRGDLFGSAGRTGKRAKRGKGPIRVSGRKTKKVSRFK